MTESSRVEIAKMTLQYLISVQVADHKQDLVRIMSVVLTEEAKNANFKDLYEIVFDVIAQSFE